MRLLVISTLLNYYFEVPFFLKLILIIAQNRTERTYRGIAALSL